MRKERLGSFQEQDKKPVIERISQLVRRHKSRSAAARAWGININTLNSYFKNDVDPPMPRENLLAQIAACEGVSLEWLQAGDNETPKTPSNGDELTRMLDFLTKDERTRLATMLARKGVETVLYLLDEDNIKLLKMDRVVKEKILGIQHRTPEDMAHDDAEARECGADNLGEALPQSLTSDKKVG